MHNDLWQHLVEVALLGNEKRELNKSLIPDTILASIIHSDTSGSVSLLETAAWSCFYNAAGRLPHKLENSVDQVFIDENGTIAPSDFGVYLICPSILQLNCAKICAIFGLMHY